jgi:acyl dehydratase
LSTVKKLLQVGDEFSKDVTFDAESIQRYATLVGDLNPLHHDDKFAANSRFGRLIASGMHTSSIMMGAAASFVSGIGQNFGLEIFVRFRRAIRAGDSARIEWKVASIEDKPGLNGRILILEGRLVRDDGEVAITARTKCLLVAPGT